MAVTDEEEEEIDFDHVGGGAVSAEASACLFGVTTATSSKPSLSPKASLSPRTSLSPTSVGARAAAGWDGGAAGGSAASAAPTKPSPLGPNSSSPRSRPARHPTAAADDLLADLLTNEAAGHVAAVTGGPGVKRPFPGAAETQPKRQAGGGRQGGGAYGEALVRMCSLAEAASGVELPKEEGAARAQVAAAIARVRQIAARSEASRALRG